MGKNASLLVAVLLAGGILFTQGGCAVGVSTAKGARAVQSSEAPAPVPSVIAGVPFLPQEDDTCGPSSLAMVLGFLGQDVNTAEIVRETRTEGLKGTLITDLTGAARRRGFAAEVADLDLPRLRERISAGVPVLLLVLLLAGGCSRIPKIIILEDPLTAAEHVELGVAYERKGELDLARREYERALRKDRKFYRARLNLGNIFLTKKEYGKAREEYRLALELRPGDAEATNNLSWAAIFSGEGIDEALARMESVVSIPTGRQANLLDTLGVLRMRANRCLLYT